MFGQDFFDCCLHIRVFVIGVDLNVQPIEVVVHDAVRTKICGFRIQKTDEWRIRAFPFCKMVIRIGQPHFFHHRFDFCVGHGILLLQCFLDEALEQLDTLLLGRSNVRSCRHTPTAALGVPIFQKVRQLVSVLGMDDHLEALAGFFLFCCHPTGFIPTCPRRCACLDLFLDRLGRLSNSPFDLGGCQLCIFLQAFIDGFCHPVDTHGLAHFCLRSSRQCSLMVFLP
nr:MAG TPA: hypothetical protein [Caudoviricetes sp.]